MTNYRSDQQTKVELFLHNLCIASRYYRAIPIPGQIRDTVDLPILPSSAVQIGWQERITMHYRVIPLDNAEYTSSNCPFEEEHNNNNNNNKMDMDFLCLENAHEKFKVCVFVAIMKVIHLFLVFVNLQFQWTHNCKIIQTT